VSEKFYCPHCGKIIKEVRVVELLWRRLLISAGLGVGCALLAFPLLAGDRLVGMVGAFIIGFVIVFLVTKASRQKKSK